MQIGRRVLWTDEREVTAQNVVQILRDVMPDFDSNVAEINSLLEIEAGHMPLEREKKSRSDIDVQTVDPIAHEVTVFKEGYHWGNVITYVQGGVKDSGTKVESEAIALFNECFNAENVGAKQSKLGHFVEICGIGYTFTDINMDYEDGESLFKYEFLDPRYAAVVRSTAYTDNRVIMAFTRRINKLGNRFYTVFSDKYRFEVVNNTIVNGKEADEWDVRNRNGERAGEINPIGMIPIAECERSCDRTGVWEREIPEMKRLNLMLSDIGNDIDQETQMIWHSNDVDFPQKVDKEGNPTGEVDKPKSNDWISTRTTRDGKTPFIKPLSTAYDYNGLLGNYVTARTLILERCNTPQRNDNSGGSTGVAMSDATGWSSAEQVACVQSLLTSSFKNYEAKIALACIKKNPKTPADSPLLKLRAIDVRPNITRTRSYELSVKSSAFANLISHGIYGLHALRVVNMFDDPNQVWDDSKELIERYQEKNFGEEEDIQETSNLPEFQIGNSPAIDGASKEAPIDVENDTEGEDATDD